MFGLLSSTADLIPQQYGELNRGPWGSVSWSHAEGRRGALFGPGPRWRIYLHLIRLRCTTGHIRTAMVAREFVSYQQVEVHSLRGKGCSPSKISREMFLPGYVKITVIAMGFFTVGCSWYAFSCENAYKWNRS